MHDASEMAEFCRSEYARLVGSLGLYCGDRDVAQELAHEALMRACRDWKKVRGMHSPSAWLHTVGVNLARSHFRRRAAERRATERFKNRTETTRGEVDDGEAAALRAVVAALPSRQRQALVMRYYLDLQIGDIAEAMECSGSTVKSLIRNALQRLRGAYGSVDLEEVGDAV